MSLKDPPLPANYECLGCLYDLGGAESRTCPECGRFASDFDLAAFGARDHARSRVFGLLMLHAVLAGMICLAFAAGVGALTRSFLEAGDALLACGAAACGSTFAGLVASRFARKRERAAYFVVWLRTQFWLNASWLSAPVSGLIVVAACFDHADANLYRPGGASLMVALIGLAIWLAATGLCLARWIVVFARGARSMELHGGIVGLAFAAASIVVGLGSMMLGVAAGSLCLRVAHAP